MHNLYTKLTKILGIYRQSSNNFVNTHGKISYRSSKIKLFGLEVMALSLTAKYENFDCRNWLFKNKPQEYKIRQFGIRI